MRTIRSLTIRLTVIACLFSGNAAIGAADGRRQQDDTSAQEALFFFTFTGANKDDVEMPEALVSDQVIMVYQHRFGLYPYIHARTGEVINGGVPQRVNISAHLRELVRDIENQIPDPEFDGYVIIDYEEWHPFWEDTARRYQDMSRDIVRRQHPDWSEARIERKARTSFENAAKLVLKRTLDKCRQIRPNAKWGIWSYPKAKFRDNNARWLWSRHDAFFPDIYMDNSLVPNDTQPGYGQALERDYVADRLVARVEYARELAGDRPVLPVVWPRYTRHNPNQWLRFQPLKQSDLAFCLERPFDYGADGVVIWENLPQPGLAEVFQEQIDNSIAPELRRILKDRGHEVDDALADAADDDEPPAETPDTDGTSSGDTRLSATPSGSKRGVGKITSRRRGG